MELIQNKNKLNYPWFLSKGSKVHLCVDRWYVAIRPLTDNHLWNKFVFLESQSMLMLWTSRYHKWVPVTHSLISEIMWLILPAPGVVRINAKTILQNRLFYFVSHVKIKVSVYNAWQQIRTDIETMMSEIWNKVWVF